MIKVSNMNKLSSQKSLMNLAITLKNTKLEKIHRYFPDLEQKTVVQGAAQCLIVFRTKNMMLNQVILH